MCHTQAVKTKAQALANPAKRAAKPFESLGHIAGGSASDAEQQIKRHQA
jgi:hypothetical protein